jgi:hypothetical protein
MDDEDVDVYFAKHDIQSVVSDILYLGSTVHLARMQRVLGARVKMIDRQNISTPPCFPMQLHQPGSARVRKCNIFFPACKICRVL